MSSSAYGLAHPAKNLLGFWASLKKWHTTGILQTCYKILAITFRITLGFCTKLVLFVVLPAPLKRHGKSQLGVSINP